MAITPIDIYNKEFDKTRKGYNAEQVDIFLDEIVESFENLYKININLKEKNEVLVEKLNNYRSIETALNKTLTTAEGTSKDIIDNAQNKSDLLVQEAEIKAKKIVQTAEEHANRIVRESEEKTINARREMEEIKRQVNIYKNRMVAVLESQIKTIVSDYETILDNNCQPVMTQRAEPELKTTVVDENNGEDLEVPLVEDNNMINNDQELVEDSNMINNDQELEAESAPNETLSSLEIDNDYFNFQEEDNNQSIDSEYSLPEEKQLEGIYQGIEQKEVEGTDESIEEEQSQKDKETQIDDFIQIDFANPESLKIEQEEVNEEPKEQGYSLEDAFLELRRAAEIYKDSSQDDQLS